ncbi:class I SAM-dependent methyltransferase [Arthrobacter sp. MDT1-65]
MTNEVSEAYARRAAEYAGLFGSMDAVHPSDRQLVATWAAGIDGRVTDAGCGPGQWTNFLTEHRLAACGVDLVPEFIEHARTTYPGVPFEVGSLNTLNVETGTIDGIFSWYSLIHHEPSTIGIPLQEFGRALKPDGALLIGFFEWPLVDKFAHGVTPAYRWPVRVLSEKLVYAGFEVVETHTRTTPTQQPHGAITARRK